MVAIKKCTRRFDEASALSYLELLIVAQFFQIKLKIKNTRKDDFVSGERNEKRSLTNQLHWVQGLVK